MTIIYLLASFNWNGELGILQYLFNWNGNPTIISHHLIGLKNRLKSHIFVLSAAAVAAEVAAAEAAAAAAAAAAELPASDIL